MKRTRSVQLVAIIIVLLVISIVVYELEVPAKTQQSCQRADSSNNFQESMQLHVGLAEADLWNMMNATGYVEQCYGNNDGLSSRVSLNQITLVQPFDFVVGYPEVAFGHNYMGQEFGESDLASINFPMQLQTLQGSGLWVNTSYSITGSRPSQMDFAYDLWIKNSRAVGAPTNSDFEVMIDPVNNFYYTLVPAAASMDNEMIVLNEMKVSSNWNVYSFPFGGTDAKLIIFVLDSPSQSLKAAISLKPQDFLSFLRSNMGYNIPENYSLMGIELGSEFYPQPFAAQSTWSFDISRLSVSTASSQVIIIPG